MTCRTGNLALYDKALSQYELFFERHGLYVLLEKLKLIAFRNLIRKMYAVACTTVFTAMISLRRKAGVMLIHLSLSFAASSFTVIRSKTLLRM
jgi:hypothetical protein